jgi:hypothetical protein
MVHLFPPFCFELICVFFTWSVFFLGSMQWGLVFHPTGQSLTLEYLHLMSVLMCFSWSYHLAICPVSQLSLPSFLPSSFFFFFIFVSFGAPLAELLYHLNDCFGFCISLFFLRWGSHYIAQTGLELLGSSNPSASASWVAETIDTHHCTWLCTKHF